MLFKKYKYLIFFFFISNSLIGQKFNHEIKFPVIGHLYSNLFNEFETNYHEKVIGFRSIPSIEYNLVYKKKWYAGIGHQYLNQQHNKEIGTLSLDAGSIRRTSINQYYIKLGIRKTLIDNFDLSLGLILLNNNKNSNTFACLDPTALNPAIGSTYYKKYVLGPDITMNYRMFKGFILALNTYFTISKAVEYDCPKNYPNHKFTLLHTNIKLGYRF